MLYHRSKPILHHAQERQRRVQTYRGCSERVRSVAHPFSVDYEKANRCLLKAKKIAEEFDIPKLLGATYINLCTIHIIDDGIKGDGTVSDNTIHLQHNAFEASLAANDPMGVIISATGLAHFASASLNNEILLNDISQFMNYQLPDSMKRFQWVYDYCKAAQELNRSNYETALSLYHQVLNHVCSPDRNVSFVVVLNWRFVV